MFEVLASWGQGCAGCTRPLETSRAGLEGRLCLVCRQQLPARLVKITRSLAFVDAAWSLGPYSGLLGGLVRSAKYGGHEQLLVDLGHELARCALRTGLDGVDGIALVPGTLARRVQRGFDPVAILGRPVSGALGAPIVPVLGRRDGVRQAGVVHSDRRSNVRGIYSARRQVQGSWLLIDDVLTTGATVSACALALREAGAAEVHVLVVAG